MINVRPLGPRALWLDEWCEPFMRWLSGAPHEAPQRGHPWNKQRLSFLEVVHLQFQGMLYHEGDPSARRLPWFWIHCTRFGGWRDYVVLEPEDPHPWYVGWITSGEAGLRRPLLDGRVRMLLGPGRVAFFGLGPHGEQRPIRCIGDGRIGETRKYAHIPLL